jgi:Uroporphyrinogen decarboxylase (URO-D)
MTRRERLMAMLKRESVDRPGVNFHVLNGLDEDPANPDSYNIYNHPSWKPLIDLTRDRTDRIVMRGAAFQSNLPDPVAELAHTEVEVNESSRTTTRTITVGAKTLTTRTRRDAAVNTVWTLEHLLKSPADIETFLSLPLPDLAGEPDVTGVLEAEEALGDSGIVMLDTPDPLCLAAALFDMGEYTVTAMTEPVLFRRLLDRFAERLVPMVEAVSKVAPGRLWRIYGPEYASPPYLPPSLFREYVCGYDKPMIEAIHRSGGYVRIHSHGNVRQILPDILAMGADAVDPIEPSPQGDAGLREVAETFGRDLVLFGNIEITDVENLPSDQFAEKVKRSLDEGVSADGRGFVLMPSSSPYGRELGKLTLRNYETMVELTEML